MKLTISSRFYWPRMRNDIKILAAIWKTDFNRRPAQTNYLIEQFMPFLKLKCLWDLNNSVKEDTIIFFILLMIITDHAFINFLISKRLFHDIMISIVVWQGINLSSHQPVLLTLNSKCADRCVVTDDMAESDNKHAWCILHMASR